jgi:hypothetical protein
LAENTFAKDGLVDLTGPVMHLSSLTPEDFYVLLSKLRHVYAYGEPTNYLVPDAAFHGFMEHCHKRIGETYFRTPRTTIKAFVDLLAVLEQNPGTDWRELLGQIGIQADTGGVEEQAFDAESEMASTGDELATFKL